MKIALLHPAFGAWGGAENIVLWLAASLRRRGHDVTVLSGAYTGHAEARLAAAGARVETLRLMRGKSWERLQLGRGGARLLPLADHVVRLDEAAMRAGARSLAQRLRSFDVVNVHNFPATWWAAAAYEAARGAMPPLIWSCNEPPRTLYPGLFDGPGPFQLHAPEAHLVCRDRAVGKVPAKILCISEYVRERVEVIYERADALTVPLGVPLPAAPPQSNPQRLLAVSRLVPAKNLETVLEAMPHLPSHALRIIGTGPDEPRLRVLAAALEVTSRVEFAGFVPEEQLSAQYAEAVALLFVPIGEPFGLVLVEAGAAGVPAVASNHGGPAEIVVDGETGCLVDAHSPTAVAAAVRQVAAERNAMGAAAARRARERFSFERYVDDFLIAIS